MIWSHLALGYLEMSLLLVPATLASYLITRLVRSNSGTMSAAVGLKLNYILMGCVLTLPFLSGMLPDHKLSNGPAQIWFAPSMYGEMQPASEPGVLAISLSKAGATKQVRDHTVNNASMYLALLAVIALTLVLGSDWRRVKRITDRSYLVRRRGAVRVLISEEMPTPFSFWVPGRAYAVLPGHLTQNPVAFNLALRHELQHHRQGDTRMVYLSETLKLLFFWNPCAHLWRKLMDETREYACDEALVGQKPFRRKPMVAVY